MIDAEGVLVTFDPWVELMDCEPSEIAGIIEEIGVLEVIVDDDRDSVSISYKFEKRALLDHLARARACRIEPSLSELYSCSTTDEYNLEGNSWCITRAREPFSEIHYFNRVNRIGRLFFAR